MLQYLNLLLVDDSCGVYYGEFYTQVSAVEI